MRNWMNFGVMSESEKNAFTSRLEHAAVRDYRRYLHCYWIFQGAGCLFITFSIGSFALCTQYLVTVMQSSYSSFLLTHCSKVLFYTASNRSKSW